MRRMLGIFTAVTAALLVVGIAWAAGDRAQSEPGAAVDVSAQAEAGVQAGAAAGAGSTSVTGQSSTSVTAASSTTATTTPGSSTSTSAAGSTSTTVKEEFTSSSGGTFQVAHGASVTVHVQAGILVLTDVSAPGWSVDIKDVRHDRIRIEFAKDGAEARFEIRIKSDGRLEIEIRRS